VSSNHQVCALGKRKPRCSGERLAYKVIGTISLVLADEHSKVRSIVIVTAVPRIGNTDSDDPMPYRLFEMVEKAMPV